MQENLYLLKTAVRSNQREIEKLLYLQNIRSLGANFDELNIEFKNLNIKPQFLIEQKHGCVSFQTSTSSAKTCGSLLKHAIENLKRAAVWQSLVRNKIILLPSKKLVTKIYRFQLLKQLSQNGKNSDYCNI